MKRTWLGNRRSFTTGLIVSAIALFAAINVRAADSPTPAADNRQIGLAEGKILLVAPKGWVRTQPRVRFIEHEFAVPGPKVEAPKPDPAADPAQETPAKDEPADGRVTVMGAGGAVEDNIARWVGQFSQADGSETKNLAPEGERKKTIAGLEVLRVDLSGTYHDSPRPLDPTAKAVDRADYRMLAAIIVSPKLGNYFVKFYGPKKLVAEHAEEFSKMIAGLQVKN